MSVSRKIDVLLGERALRVGTMWFEARGGREAATFRYDQDWLKNPKAFALAPTMPLVDAPVTTSRRAGGGEHAVALPGPIADAAPDAWGRRILRRDLAERTREPATDIDFLLGVNDATRMGALRFADEQGVIQRPAGAGRPIAPATIELEALQRAAHAFERRDESGEDLQRLVAPGSSLGGARPKASVVGPNGRLFVAKFTSDADRNLAVERAEVMTLRLARRVGLIAPNVDLVVAAGSPVALIERFDRAAGGRLHYVSAQTFMGYESAGEGSYGELAEAVREHCGDVPGNLQELYRRLAYNILVSNTDDHLKNHGFLLAANGRWTLSPVFDVNPQPERSRQLKTSILPDDGHEASIKAAIEAAPLFDLSSEQASTLVRDMARTIASEWKELGIACGMTQQDLRHYAPAFEHEESRLALTPRSSASSGMRPG